jgi:hypothetical protein
MGRGIDELIHALVIEENRDAAGCKMNGRPILERRRVCVVNLIALAGVQLNRERLERLACQKRLEGFVEMLRGHRWGPCVICS